MSDEIDPELLGTAQLAQSALASPDPPAEAEAASLSRVEALMQGASLSPRPLHQSPSAPSAPRPWWARLLFWRR